MHVCDVVRTSKQADPDMHRSPMDIGRMLIRALSIFDSSCVISIEIRDECDVALVRRASTCHLAVVLDVSDAESFISAVEKILNLNLRQGCCVWKSILLLKDSKNISGSITPQLNLQKLHW